MARWEWLVKPDDDWHFIRRVVLKSTLLFFVLNIIYALAQPLPTISQLSAYNMLVPGRERFPYSDNPSEAFSLSYGVIEGLFAAHEIDASDVPEDAYQVVLIGDSSVWGVLLDVDETLSGCINVGDYTTTAGQEIVVHNLGYPVLSVFKDVLILEEALTYEPDAVVWLVTLQALFDNEQLRHPILQTNPDRVRGFIEAYDLQLDMSDLPQPNFFDRTIIGQRRELAEWLRLQVYGLAWWMTKADYAPGGFLGAPVRNLAASEGILNRDDINIGNLDSQGVLAWDVLDTGVALAENAEVPLLLVNEPIFISDGLNSDIRYNEYYPRWAYDEYRESLRARTQSNGWRYLDLWDRVPAEAFTDTPFHYRPPYTCEVAADIAQRLVTLSQQQ
jgi:hypothetical protein